MANSVDPDEMDCYKLSHLDLHCLSHLDLHCLYVYLSVWMKRLKATIKGNALFSSKFRQSHQLDPEAIVIVWGLLIEPGTETLVMLNKLRCCAISNF